MYSLHSTHLWAANLDAAIPTSTHTNTHTCMHTHAHTDMSMHMHMHHQTLDSRVGSTLITVELVCRVKRCMIYITKTKYKGYCI